jgi:PIN domain nuclease of toxin-antitoxin system
VILLDASALIALLRGEPAEADVKALLHRGGCATPSTCLAEVVDQLIRRNRVQPEDVVDRLDPLIEASLGVVPIENRLGWQAGEHRAVNYVRSGTDLSLADCMLLACAGPDDELASSDGSLLAIARELDIRVIPLPDSRGRRPT